MSKKYPDVSVLFAKKEEWRRRMNARPLEEKLAVAIQLKNLSKELPKLAKVNSQLMKTAKNVYRKGFNPSCGKSKRRTFLSAQQDA